MPKYKDLDLISNAGAMDWFKAGNAAAREKIVRELDWCPLAHVYFVSQLYAVGEAHDRIQYRQILEKIKKENE